MTYGDEITKRIETNLRKLIINMDIGLANTKNNVET
jgi:hypothetical protein